MSKELLPLLWVDIETPGVNAYWYSSQPILEFGAIITDVNLNIQDTFHGYLDPGPYIYNHDNVPEVVHKMHTENGLWKDIKSAPPAPSILNWYYLHGARYLSAEHLDYSVNQWLRTFFDVDDDEYGFVKLAGSGVSHFDSRIIKRQLSLTWHCLDGFDHDTKPTLDLGVVRRLLTYYGMEQLWPDRSNLRPLDEILRPHRALDDLEIFINQARALRGTLTDLLNK